MWQFSLIYVTSRFSSEESVCEFLTSPEGNNYEMSGKIEASIVKHLKELVMAPSMFFTQGSSSTRLFHPYFANITIFHRDFIPFPTHFLPIYLQYYSNI